MPNIMENTNGEKKGIVTYNSIFLNSDAIFIEYDDVIKSPFFIFLLSIQNNEVLTKIFDLTEINNLSIDELYEWYINRKNQNIFLSLPLQENVLETLFNNDINLLKEWSTHTLYEELEVSDYFIKTNSDLNFLKTLKILLSKSEIVTKYYIYTPVKSNSIRQDIISTFGEKINYVYGDINDVLKDNEITNNSTFVFSDITKIHNLKDNNIINQSSILIADRYGYNYKNKDDLVIDLNELLKNDLFKIDFFNNIEYSV